MTGYHYRDFGNADAGQDALVQQKLRRAQMERALGEAAGLAARGVHAAARPAPQALSGEVLEKDDPGGDGARLIAPDGAGPRTPRHP
ncbi:hypothetical protein [Roseovarius aquimarinus]|uniref:Uncharacterized protein n=1 Tax=Roseovarius aquimarinus TaxID=1229156 RepID=A0ABW7I6M7_9RHOB